MLDTHLFCNSFPKEALVQGFASCHLSSISPPTWCTSSQASYSVHLLLLLKQLSNDRRLHLTIQKQSESLARKAAHKYSGSLPFPAKQLKNKQTRGRKYGWNLNWKQHYHWWEPELFMKITICVKDSFTYYLHKIHNCYSFCSFRFIAAKAIKITDPFWFIPSYPQFQWSKLAATKQAHSLAVMNFQQTRQN